MSSILFNTRNKYFLYLLFLIIIGAYLRIRDFPGIWIGDVGRDYLMAKHIFSDGILPYVGPRASGLNFFNPPYYYYFLGLVYLFFPNLFSLIGFFTSLHLISILFIFEIGRLLQDKKTGAIAATFYTLAANPIFYSRSIWAAYIIIPFSLLILLLFLKYLKNSRYVYLILSLAVMIFAGQMEYSILSYMVILPIFTLLFNRKKLPEVLLTLLNAAVVFLLLMFPLFIYFGHGKVLLSIFTFPGEFISGNFINSFSKNILLFLNPVFNAEFSFYFIFQIVICLLISIIFNKNRLTILRLTAVIILIPVILSLLLAISGKSTQEHFFTPIFPLFYIFLALTVRNFSQTVNRHENLQFVLFPIISYLIFCLFSKYPNITEHPYHLAFADSRNTANWIISDAKRIRKINHLKNLDFFQVIYITNGNNFDSTMIWYFLEEKLGRSIVRIDDSKNVNLVMITKTDLVYLICQTNDRECLHLFPRYYRGYQGSGLKFKIKNDILSYDNLIYLFKRNNKLLL